MQLGLITTLLLLINYFFGNQLNLHTAYNLIVVFFTAQTFVLFRIDDWIPKEWSVQASLVKTIVRLLASLTLALVLLITQENKFSLVIQFFSIYLIFMIFEIGSALINLRRN